MPRSRRRSPSRSSSKSGSDSSSRSRRPRKKAEKKKPRSRSRSARRSDRRRSRSEPRRSDRRRSRSRSRSRSRKASRKRSRSRKASRGRSKAKRSKSKSRSRDRDGKKPASKKESTKAASPKPDKSKDGVSKKSKLPVRALANALSVVKKDAKAAEQERRESGKKARQDVAKNDRETNAQRRASKGTDDADDGRSRLRCEQPDCEFKGAERLDSSERKGRKGKGKGRGKREAKGEPLSQETEKLSPEELDRRQKRAARFGGKDEAKPAPPEPADIPQPAVQTKSTESKPTEKVGREENSKNKGLRAWSDDENGQAEVTDGK